MSEYNCLNMLVAVTLAAVCLAGRAAAAIAPRDHKVYYDVSDADNLYKNYLQEYNKQYTVEEYGKRLEIFKETLKKINELNAMHPQTVFGPTVFSDMTPEEQKGRSCLLSFNSTKAVSLYLDDDMVYEANFDWRDKGVVSPVKDQGSCGSCYIFSAIGSIEGQYAMKHKECLSFSEQQALDCVETRHGCYGGFPHETMNGLAKDSKAVMLESDYPYNAKQMACKEAAGKKRATVLGGKQLAARDEEILKKYLVQYGPLSIGLSAGDLLMYAGGILKPVSCTQQADHAVLLVGYGEEAGTPFWIIKNSWGTRWGEQGYLRMVRGVKACAITTYVASSEVA